MRDWIEATCKAITYSRLSVTDSHDEAVEALKAVTGKGRKVTDAITELVGCFVDERERVCAQRDRAWRTLSRLEDALGPDTYQLGLILADGHGREDIEEYNAVIGDEEAKATKGTETE